MGNKAAAKRHVKTIGVPCVPGYEGDDQSDTTMQSAAERIGYPIMIKAAAGGGGRGMRLVSDATQLNVELPTARREAASAFGADELSWNALSWDLVTSRFSCWLIALAMWCISVSGIAPCSVGTRKSSKKRPVRC